MSLEKLAMQSPDLVNENIEKLADLFPNCVTVSAEGKVIDFDLLKQELNHAIVEGNKERYRLEWPGKREAIVTANLPTNKTLRPIREDSVDFDNTENLYIEGDNLEVLKLLQESYLGKIKMIYIDPPYNTGNDYIYKDNFTQGSEEYKEESGQKDEYNQRLVANPETAGRYHSDWLSMMYPRLKLARNLLKNDGVIFISIDDNEVHNLRKICDEIFGEGNFLANVVWQKKYGPANDAKGISQTHEHILTYSKNSSLWSPGLLPRNEEQLKAFKNPDNDPRGPWRASDLSARTYSKNCDYIITGPKGESFMPPPSRSWIINKDKYQELLKDDRITFGVNEDGRPMQKKFLSEVKDGITPETWWNRDKVGDNKIARYEMKELFPENIFDTPKPTKLLYYIIKVSNCQLNDIILDFYSGSGTTAQAVMQLNAEDGGNRRFVLVQLPEETQESTEAYKAGYKNICEIGKERIRRAAKKIKDETNADIDYGFRVYRLDSSNMEDVYYKPQDYQQSTLDLFTDNVKTDRTSDDLLAQVMLDWGLQLSLKVEQATVGGKQVFKVAENSLYACFDKGIDEAFAKAIAKDQPLRIVFRDNGFNDDTAKSNVKQLLKQLSPETEMKVI